MNNDEVRLAVERLIRANQVNAVIRAIQRGHRPRIGDVLEHTLDRPFASPARSWDHDPHLNTYEFQVEAWHLDEAERLADRNGSMNRPDKRRF